MLSVIEPYKRPGVIITFATDLEIVGGAEALNN